MLESGGVGAELNLDDIPRPEQVTTEQWLCAFPSFGFLMAVDSSDCAEVQQNFTDNGISCAVAGHFTAEPQLIMHYQQQSACYWDISKQPLTGMSNH